MIYSILSIACFTLATACTVLAVASGRQKSTGAMPVAGCLGMVVCAAMALALMVSAGIFAWFAIK
jgi:hypothetical protein